LTGVRVERTKGHTLAKTLVYLKRPQMSSVFEVTITVQDGSSGRLEGGDLVGVAKFLRVSDGVPQFDLEYDGCLFCRCRLATTTLVDSIPFSFESIVSVEAFKSDPQAS